MWWLELNRRRARGFGISPLTFPDIAAWSDLSHARATPFEVGLIVQIDNAFLDWNDGLPADPDKPPTTPLTGALFDALFA